MRALERLRQRVQGDNGIGVVTVVFVMAIVMAMTVTAVTVAKNNFDNVRGDRQSLTALATSEAGVAQALTYLRTANLASLVCTEAAVTTDADCQSATPSWTSAKAPMQVKLNGTTGDCTSADDCFKVWIGTVQEFDPACPARRATPPGRCSGIYRIHSTGISGNGPGARRVAVDATVSPLNYPLGVFSETDFSGNGNIGIHAESVYTGGCIANRQRDDQNGSGFQFQWDSANNRPVIDKFTGRPAAANAVGGISTGNSCAGNGNNGPVHTSTQKCNLDFKYDRSGAGAALTSGDGCYGAFTASPVYPATSAFTTEDLKAIGYRPRGLTDAQYASLKTQAQSLGTYNLSPSSLNAVLTNLASAGVSSPVLYWDNGPVSLNQNDFPAAFSRALNETAGCAQRTVTIIVAGAGNDLRYQGGNTSPFLTAAIFVPDGTLTGQGGRNTIGTVYAKTIDLGGNVDFYLDQCFANSPPGGVLDVQVTNFREDDGTDIN